MIRLGVMQSSRYVTGTMKDARKVCEEDAELLCANGFEVIRQKIEAVAGITEGVPETKNDSIAHSSDHYFEYHIQVATKNAENAKISPEDDEKLIAIAKQLQNDLRVQVPVSWNAFKEAQRFLNTRTYGLGKQESYEIVDKISKAIEEQTNLTVLKVIREFIASDDNKQLDAGWLEPL
jgi:hypothetical protein